MRSVCLHARHYHLCYAFSTQRWVSDMETVIIPGKISIIPPLVPPTGRGKIPEAPPCWGILGRNWRNRTRCRNEIVIRGAHLEDRDKQHSARPIVKPHPRFLQSLKNTISGVRIDE
ncbi:hypothetical protein E2C01_030487 [Portunus trituberculatus]|uniref:Uncharacterized protein n=1 Tax=Portunus trituberculatus TaxID=210409 RepID=A0A5B7EUZ7_PORTR|nr:hypothetical protein [Portunus trituberculatus]